MASTLARDFPGMRWDDMDRQTRRCRCVYIHFTHRPSGRRMRWHPARKVWEEKDH